MSTALDTFVSYLDKRTLDRRALPRNEPIYFGEENPLWVSVKAIPFASYLNEQGGASEMLYHSIEVAQLLLSEQRWDNMWFKWYGHGCCDAPGAYGARYWPEMQTLIEALGVPAVSYNARDKYRPEQLTGDPGDDYDDSDVATVHGWPYDGGTLFVVQAGCMVSCTMAFWLGSDI